MRTFFGGGDLAADLGAEGSWQNLLFARSRIELSMPPTITLDEAVGFNLWAIKAVLNGRADEVIDLARSNLFR